MVELAGRLVVPGAPAGAAVDRHHGPLVGGGDHPFRALRIDPEEVIVVAAGRAADLGERRAAIRRAAQRLPHGPHDVGILWIGGEAGEVGPGQAPGAIDPPPRRAGVVRAVEAGCVAAVHRSIDPPSTASRSHRDADAPERAGRPAGAGDPRPGRAAVGRFEEAAAGSDAGLEVGEPRPFTGLPERRKDRVRRRRVGAQVHCTGAVVDEQYFLPARSCVGGPEDSTLGMRPEYVSLGGDEHHVRVARIDPDAPDVSRLGQPSGFPGGAAVEGAVDPVAGGAVPAGGDLAGAHPEGLRLGRSRRQRADRSGGLVLEQRAPGAAGVGGFPHAAVGGAEKESLRPPGHPGRARRPAGAQRADEPPAQCRIVLGSHGGSSRGGGHQEDGETGGPGAQGHGAKQSTRSAFRPKCCGLEVIAGPCA